MRRTINYYFLALAAILILFGLFFIATLSASASLKAFGNTSHYFFNQLRATAIGLVCLFVAMKIPLRFVKKASVFLLIVNLFLLILVLTPWFGAEFWGAKRWISMGNITFQPSEFLKITAILYFGAWLSSKLSKDSKEKWSALVKRGYENFIKIWLPFVLFLVLIILLLNFQKDLGTSGIIIITLLAMYFSAETPLWQSVATVFLGAASALILIKKESYRIQRFFTFLNPEADPLGSGFQLKQSILALGSGGILGKGFGMSTQKFNALPQAMSDSVFAVLGEELGIVGSGVLVVLFILFFWQGIRIAKLANDKFAKLTAVGISTWIIIQFFVNVSSLIGLLPLTGIPLPFFSYGGSHLIMEMAGVGMLLNISKNG